MPEALNNQHNPTLPCGHPKSSIKKARGGAGWCYWCGECVKQALAATQDTNADSDRETGRSA